MLGVVKTVLLYAKSVLYYTLLASFYIGKTLFELISATALQSSALCSDFLAGVQVLLEDFDIFLRDLSDHAGFGLRLVYKSIECTLGIFTFIYGPIASTLQWYCNAITTFFTWLGNLYNNTSTLVSLLLMYVKKLFVLLGSGVWFAITIVPFAIFSLGLLFVYYVGILYNEILSINYNLWRQSLTSTKNIIEFFWDVPMESLLGLATIAFVIYIIMQYKRSIKALILNCVRRIQRRFAFSISISSIRRKLKVISTPVKSPTPNSKVFETGTCVICQTNPKNILILPCKHLCICEECMRQVRRYSGRCPLCRTQMDQSVLVYV